MASKAASAGQANERNDRRCKVQLKTAPAASAARLPRRRQWIRRTSGTIGGVTIQLKTAPAASAAPRLPRRRQRIRRTKKCSTASSSSKRRHRHPASEKNVAPRHRHPSGVIVIQRAKKCPAPRHRHPSGVIVIQRAKKVPSTSSSSSNRRHRHPASEKM